jgi:hypothetical protein
MKWLTWISRLSLVSFMGGIWEQSHSGSGLIQIGTPFRVLLYHSLFLLKVGWIFFFA